MRKTVIPALIAALFVLFPASCNVADSFAEEQLPEPLTPVVENIPYITASLVPNVTRTEYSMPDGYTLTTVWAVNDRISVVPAYGYRDYAGVYRITEAGGGVGVFQQESPVLANALAYGIFYPGDRIKTLIQFMNFTYSGQVQSKSNPMGHLSAYHTMFKEASSYAIVDFSDAEQSSCMRFNLSGMTFDHPTRITVTIRGGGTFYLNNPRNSWYVSTPAETYVGEQASNDLSLELDGYGSETSLLAYMMMSSHDVSLSAGCTIRVKVQCADGEYYSDTAVPSAMTLTGGYCHSLTVDGGWSKSSASDAKVITLQTASVGNGIDVVILGDGFREEDILSGDYDAKMREAYDSFFSVQPLAYFKNRFNVYYVIAVSPNHFGATVGLNGATNNPDSTTVFNVRFSDSATTVEGDNDLIRTYAARAFATNAEARIKDATIILIANENCRAGTCHQSYNPANGLDYGQTCAIAYCALGKNLSERAQLVRHEASGHGFGKLADEYYGTSGSYNSGWWDAIKEDHQLGICRNVDMHVDDYIYGVWGSALSLSLTTAANVYWKDLFGTSNNYESSAVESLGVFQGGNLQPVGFCRPTEDGNNSIMNKNSGFFNAPSRRTMYYRAKRLSGDYTTNCYGTATELNDFLNWDATVFLPSLSTKTRSFGVLQENANPIPSAPVVYHKGHWEGTKFIEE